MQDAGNWARLEDNEEALHRLAGSSVEARRHANIGIMSYHDIMMKIACESSGSSQGQLDLSYKLSSWGLPQPDVR
ncbi:hypothetical protein HNQ04_004018 [Deinococcus radiopugnans ATCC 19172]|uniref:Uncharacterized protein n=1 Tax=Deinococcus radiopugnans ATCC 19172 TaxID=585398 RepID=A0ABR6NXG4_9DEIO|nr:hypothetical protein [Deinococcus radiopugnans ATCC 19172]